MIDKLAYILEAERMTDGGYFCEGNYLWEIGEEIYTELRKAKKMLTTPEHLTLFGIEIKVNHEEKRKAILYKNIGEVEL